MNRPLLNNDFYWIILDRYRIDASIGIHAFEREAAQPVAVTIAAAFERRDGARDKIADVVDYDFLRDGVAALVSRGHINLQETLCAAVLDLCREGGAKGAIVRSEKTKVYPDADAVGCEMSWFDAGVLYGA